MISFNQHVLARGGVDETPVVERRHEPPRRGAGRAALRQRRGRQHGVVFLPGRPVQRLCVDAPPVGARDGDRDLARDAGGARGRVAVPAFPGRPVRAGRHPAARADGADRRGGHRGRHRRDLPHAAGPVGAGGLSQRAAGIHPSRLTVLHGWNFRSVFATLHAQQRRTSRSPIRWYPDSAEGGTCRRPAPCSPDPPPTCSPLSRPRRAGSSWSSAAPTAARCRRRAFPRWRSSGFTGAAPAWLSPPCSRRRAAPRPGNGSTGGALLELPATPRQVAFQGAYAAVVGDEAASS